MLRNLGMARLAIVAGVGLGVLVFIIYFATRMSSGSMDLLYGDLSQTDAASIVQQLKEENVLYRVEDKNGFVSIYTPSDRTADLRLMIAGGGLVSGSAGGYSILDNQSPLGTTDLVQRLNVVRVLEGELVRSIKTIKGVEDARVHLVQQDRAPFMRRTAEPSASVVVRMRGARLQPGQVVAIQNLVASSVLGLKPSSVTVVDDRGTLLTRSMDDTGLAIAETQNDLRKAEEARLADSIERLLANTVGPGKVRAEVSVEMDFNRVQTSRRVFDPDGAVLRSSTSIVTQSQTNETQQNVTVQQNLPEGQMDQASGPSARSQENHNETTENYDITETAINELKEAGVIRRLSVAVMVDGITTVPEGGGEPVWTERSPEEMEKIRALVRSAMGYDASRRDTVEVVNMRFVDLESEFDSAAEWSFLGFSKPEVMKLAEGFGVALVAILVILLVVRPLIQRAFESLPQSSAGILTPDMQQAPQLTGPGGPIPMGALGSPDDIDEAEELIDIDKVEGRVKASSIRKIGEIVDKHPEEALSIVRNWLYEEG
nr:flagellar basal-body MS-ring/collar protein FliF [Phaeovibrio sulfidiphilus]